MRYLIIICLLLTTNFLVAQSNEGIIMYKETVQLEIELPEGQEHLKDLIPSSTSQDKALYFIPGKSLYKDFDPSDDEQEISHKSDNGNEQIQIKIASGSADNRLYKDFSSGEMVDQRDFLGKKFLIDGTLKEMKWKISGEQKKILDYTCQKAFLKDSEKEVIAWFATQIPISNGPDVYGQLPGLILAMEFPEDKRTTEATSIAFTKVEAGIIEQPKKGKKVTREEFQKIREEKMKEMGSGNGRTVIRMEMDRRGN